MPARIAGTFNLGGASHVGSGPTGPESIVSPQPGTAILRLNGASLFAWGGDVSVSLDDRLAVVADAALYNHGELAGRTGQSSDAAPAQLIAAAYSAWGRDCTAFMEGDFAFALFDREAHELFCARDHFGVRPFYFRKAGAEFRFASTTDQLREAAVPRRDLDDMAVVDYIAGRVRDTGSTLYQEIEKLPPAHDMTVSTSGTSCRRYWNLRPRRRERAARSYRDEFRHLFQQAVRQRTHSGGRTGVLISGGLDSSSIACLARAGSKTGGGAPLPSFSMHFSEPEAANEKRYIDAVLKDGGFEPTVLCRDNYRPFHRIDELLVDMDGPVLAPNLACIRPLIEQAGGVGVDVLLDGHGGDEVVSHGYGRLDDLARQGRWKTLWKEASAVADNYGRPVASLVSNIARRHRRLDARLLAFVLRGRRQTKSSGVNPRSWLKAEAVELLRQSNGSAPYRSYDPAAGEGVQHLRTLNDPLQSYAFEVLAHFYRACGVQGRFPFWDRKLVEFCVGLPGEAKLRDGWSRLVLREAMDGVIPDEIRTRRDKVDFGTHLARGMVTHHHEQICDLLADGDNHLDRFVDLSAARTAYAAMAENPEEASGPQVQQIWRLVSMATWMRMSEPVSGGSSTNAFSAMKEAAR